LQVAHSDEFVVLQVLQLVTRQVVLAARTLLRRLVVLVDVLVVVVALDTGVVVVVDGQASYASGQIVLLQGWARATEKALHVEAIYAAFNLLLYFN